MNKRPLIVGLNSSRGKTGKDTIVQYASFGISQDYVKLSLPDKQVRGLKSIRLAFGDALKDECAYTICGFSPEWRAKIRKAMDDQNLKDTPMESLRINQMPNGGYRDWLYDHTDFDRKVFRTPRFHLQQFGNGYIRSFHNNESAWLDIVKARYNELKDVDVVFITDMRQQNEADWIKDMGGLTVFVSRDWTVPEVDQQPPHETDNALAGRHQFDNYIINKKGHVTEAADYLARVIREKLDGKK